jgi:hypothetical protein
MGEVTDAVAARTPTSGSARLRGWGRDVLFLAGLCGVVAYAYAPSLDHAHRADQWFYFLDTMDRDGFADTFVHTYSYNRMTNIAPGDRALFRPVLFSLLAAEREWFGYEPRGWHVAGILLHVTVVALFFLLARTLFQRDLPVGCTRAERISRNLWQLTPYVLTAFFALNYAIIEQVIWSHVNGYMLFLSLVLGAVLLLFRARAGRPNRRALCMAWTLLLVAAFTYESGQIIAVLLAGYVFLGRKAARPAFAAAAFCCIPLLYQAANRVDIVVNYSPEMEIDESMRFPIPANPKATVRNLAHYLAYVGLQPFERGRNKIKPGTRVEIGEPAYTVHRPTSKTFVVWGIVGVFLAGGALAAATAVFREGLRSERFLRSAVLAGLFGLQAAVIVLGRLDLRGHGILVNNSYYTYPALCILLLGVCLAVHETSQLRSGRLCLPLALGLLILLGRTTAGNVRVVRESNDRMREWSRIEVQRVRHVLACIDAHRAEPGFSLAIDPNSLGELKPIHGLPKLLLVARGWTVGANPKYVIVVRDGRLETLVRSEYENLTGRDDSEFAVLIEAGSSYNIFRYRNRYYGVLHFDGTFDPRRRDYSYLIAGSSPSEVLAREEDLLERQADDVARGDFVPPTGSPPVTTSRRDHASRSRIAVR